MPLSVSWPHRLYVVGGGKSELAVDDDAEVDEEKARVGIEMTSESIFGDDELRYW